MTGTALPGRFLVLAIAFFLAACSSSSPSTSVQLPVGASFFITGSVEKMESDQLLIRQEPGPEELVRLILGQGSVSLRCERLEGSRIACGAVREAPKAGELICALVTVTGNGELEARQVFLGAGCFRLQP